MWQRAGFACRLRLKRNQIPAPDVPATWPGTCFIREPLERPFLPPPLRPCAAIHDHAHAEGELDATYTISFARLEVGDISATVVFGDSDYAISARGRAGGVMKALVDGEGSFAARSAWMPVISSIEMVRWASSGVAAAL